MAELTARLIAGVPTLPALIQDRLVQALPGPLFSLILDRLLYLGKPLFFGGLLLFQLLLGGLVGLIIARWHRPIEILAVLWVLTGAVVLPLAGRPAFAASAGFAVASLLAFAIFGLVLEALLRPVWGRGQPSSDAARSDPGMARRQVLTGIVLFVTSAILARRTIGNLPTLPALGGSSGSEGGPAPGLPAEISPPNDFYLVSKNIDDPQVKVDGWRLQVDGLVDRPLTLTYAEVLAMPAKDVTRTLECISNEVGGDLISNGQWTGVQLSEVFARAGVHEDAQVLHFTSVDGYTENMTIRKAMDANTLLVYKLDGQPLPNKHGFPLRVLGAGTYGMKNPKWLTRIELGAKASQGFWEQQGWNPDAAVQTMSRIDTPSVGSVPAGNVMFNGLAFAGDRGIQRVELSTDGGRTWQNAHLLPAAGPLTWTFWQSAAKLATGRYTVQVRATDGSGRLQTAQQADPFPAGATGYHTIQILVYG
ncbi:MAG: molybdopterin-dependent oxidoreductase [Chloroflexota bacterium]